MSNSGTPAQLEIRRLIREAQSGMKRCQEGVESLQGQIREIEERMGSYRQKVQDLTRALETLDTPAPAEVEPDEGATRRVRVPTAQWDAPHG